MYSFAPSGDVSGQYRLAIVSLITTAPGAFSPSSGDRSRPWSNRMRMVLMYDGLTMRELATGSDPGVAAGGRPSIWNDRFISPPASGSMFVRPADVTSGMVEARSTSR